MQAGSFADGSEPAVLMLYGLDDMTVGMVNIENMQAAFTAVGTCSQVKTFDGVSHIGIVSAFTWALKNQTVRDVFFDFIDETAPANNCT